MMQKKEQNSEGTLKKYEYLLEVCEQIVDKVEDGCDIETDKVLEAYIEEAKQIIKKTKI